jgi:MoaA/NifB/PqqE/SkfB family radical SAM enzyme
MNFRQPLCRPHPLLYNRITLEKKDQYRHLIKNLVRVTLRCNASCLFCNIPPESEPGFAEPDEKTLLRQVRSAAAACRGEGIVISGGEPTLRKVTLKAAGEARKHGASWVEIQTNGLLVGRKEAGAMAAAGISKALVALLSHDSKMHDRLTGVAGAWKKTVRSVHALHDAGMEVILNLLMTGWTAGGYSRLVGFAIREFPYVREMNFSAVSATGRCASRPDLWPDLDEARPAVRTSLRLAHANGVRPLNPFCGLPVCAGWENDLDVCVEAQEMRAGRQWGRSPADIEGLRQEGEKVQLPLCYPCCFRPVCGGTWRKIAEVRGEKGLRPPVKAARFPHLLKRGKRRTGTGPKKRRALFLAPVPKGPAGGLLSVEKSRIVQTLEETLLILKKARSQCLQVSFTLAGPGLPAWLVRAVAAAMDHGYQTIQIAAQGESLAAPGLAAGLVSAGANEFIVPVWSALPHVHDALARSAGSFKRTIRGLAALVGAGRRAIPEPSVVLAAPLLARAAVDLRGCAALCDRLGIGQVLVLPPPPDAPPPPPASVVSAVMAGLQPRLTARGIRFHSIGLSAKFGIPAYDDSSTARVLSRSR